MIDSTRQARKVFLKALQRTLESADLRTRLTVNRAFLRSEEAAAGAPFSLSERADANMRAQRPTRK
jgi:uncharacterized FlgJ-related protein